MEIFTLILNITMIAFLARAIFTIAGGFLMSKKVKQAQQNQLEIKEKLKEQNEQLQAHIQSLMVQDDYCGKMVSKEKAFIVRIDNVPHHFCSWDCRQKYLAETATA
ncbi:MAG TPA: hypothetical protein DIW17_11475 [Clostridiales bacterium]|jgi:hypothetical protein|nr:hypothetical protein [Clostridia bacterium]MDD4680343.1 hypothetical protein [Clostridia bacterium]HCS74478.1 hypothetical protein [Clostridiales bacterium]